jgi:dihydroorotate dehydrogenase (fumarate)/dihydropyrimidine dehydrogenase (NAD+) subunit PreA
VADLSVEIAGVHFKNPVWLASGEPTWGFEMIKRGIDAGAGGVVAKSLNVPPPEIRGLYQGKRFCVFDENRKPVKRGKIPKFFTLYSRSARPGFPDNEDEWIEELEKSEKYAVLHDAHVVGSLTTMPVEDQKRVARKMEQIGLTMLEIDAGCPHFDEYVGGKYEGMEKLVTARKVSDLNDKVKPVTEAVSVPVFAKLSPMAYTDLVTLTRWVVETCGASGVTCHNRFMGLMIDIEAGKPFLQGYAGVGGPWMLPLSLRWVGRIHQAMPKVQVLGSSGASDWQDVVAFLMAGASAAQFCSAVMCKGYRIIRDAVTGLNEFLDRKGYGSAREIIGIASEAALSYEEIARLPEYAIHPRKASVLLEKCTDCGRCLDTCWFGAMEKRDELYEVNLEGCTGCGNCEIVCPAEAIHWIR